MKLSKKNQACQQAIRSTLASGKSVSGLLVGALALATTGCSPESHTRGPIGRFPDASYEERAQRNANNEKPRRIPMGDVPMNERPPAQTPGSASCPPRDKTPPKPKE